MQPFGARCYVHVDKGLRKKHENTAREMRLLGYEAYNIFRVWDPQTNGIYCRRDVRFPAQESRFEELEEEPEIEALEDPEDQEGTSPRPGLTRKEDKSTPRLDSKRSR